MKRILFLIPVFFCLLFLCSCNNLLQKTFGITTEENISVKLPQWPPEDSMKEYYPPLSRWLITIESGSYNISFSYNEKTNLCDLPDFVKDKIFILENVISIKTKKNKLLSITASPVIKTSDGKDSFIFNKAGLIYPVNKNNITWEGGFLASILEEIIKEKHQANSSSDNINNSISSFNWKKAAGQINENITTNNSNLNKEIGYNPWFLNHDTIIKKIKENEFSKTNLKSPATKSKDISNFISEGKKLLSPFIPENENIFISGKILLKKTGHTVFYDNSGIEIDSSTLY